MKMLMTVVCLFVCLTVFSQEKNAHADVRKPMHKFVIEREIPNAGKLTPDQLQGIATQSCATIDKMSVPIQWVQSYVTDNKVYCVYLAESEDTVREHARLAGFPANKISEVKTVIDPTSAH